MISCHALVFFFFISYDGCLIISTSLVYTHMAMFSIHSVASCLSLWFVNIPLSPFFLLRERTAMGFHGVSPPVFPIPERSFRNDLLAASFSQTHTFKVATRSQYTQNLPLHSRASVHMQLYLLPSKYCPNRRSPASQYEHTSAAPAPYHESSSYSRVPTSVPCSYMKYTYTNHISLYFLQA